MNGNNQAPRRSRWIVLVCGLLALAMVAGIALLPKSVPAAEEAAGGDGAGNRSSPAKAVSLKQEEYVRDETEGYEADRGARESLLLRSDEEITAENLGDYLEVDSYLGDVPAGFTVTDLGGGLFEVTPEGDYQEGCTYDFAARGGARLFTDAGDEVETLTRRIHKDDAEVVELQDSLVYVDRARVEDMSDPGNGTYSFVINRMAAAPAPGTTLCLLNGYDGWAAGNGGEEAFGALIDDDTLFVTVTGSSMSGGNAVVDARDAELGEVLEAVDVSFTQVLDVNEDTVDLRALEEDVARSAGVGQLAELFAYGIANDETYQELAEEGFAGGVAADATVPFRSGLDLGDVKTISLGMKNGVTVKAKLSSTAKNENYDWYTYCQDEDPDWNALSVTITYNTQVNKVKIKAEVTITEYLFVNMQGYKDWDGKNLDFDYALNTYSQSNLDFTVLVCSTNERSPLKSNRSDGWFDISQSIEDTLTPGDNDDNIVARLQEMLDCEGSYIELCEVQLLTMSVAVVPILPVFDVNVNLNFVLKVNFAAGMSTKISYLDATQVGMQGSTHGADKGLRSYNHKLVGADRYSIDMYACGYLGIRCGFEGQLTLSFHGLKQLGQVGVELEFGVYMDLYGYVHLRVAKLEQYRDDIDREFFGGYYIEVGLYMEINTIAESEVFGVGAEFCLFDHKWPLFSMGSPHVLYGVSAESGPVLMHQNSESLVDLFGLKAQVLDITTGEVEDISVGDSDLEMYAAATNSYFRQENGTAVLKAARPFNSDYLNQIYHMSENSKAAAFTVSLYVDAPFSGAPRAEYNGKEYNVFTRTVYWADPTLKVDGVDDFEQPCHLTVTYIYDDGTEETVEELDLLFGTGLDSLIDDVYKRVDRNNEPGVECSADDMYFGRDRSKENQIRHIIQLNGYKADRYLIYEDTEIVRYLKRKQYPVAFVWFDNYNRCWQTAVQTVNYGDTPVVPEGAENDNMFSGWRGMSYNSSDSGIGPFDLGPVAEEHVKRLKLDPGYTIGQPTGVLTYMEPRSSRTEALNRLYLIEDGNGGGTWMKGRYAQIYEAQYKPATVTFLYGNDGVRSTTAEAAYGEDLYLYRIVKDFVSGYNGLNFKGWDTDGDGAVDVKEEQNGRIPCFTQNCAIYRAVYSPDDVKITVLNADGTEAGTVKARTNDGVVFTETGATLNGTPLAPFAAVRTAAGVKFGGWEYSYNKSTWYGASSSGFSLLWASNLYFRPVLLVTCNITYVYPSHEMSWEAYCALQEADALTKTTIEAVRGTRCEWENAGAYPTFLLGNDCYGIFLGWDTDGDGVRNDYTGTLKVTADTTVTAIYECVPVTVDSVLRMEPELYGLVCEKLAPDAVTDREIVEALLPEEIADLVTIGETRDMTEFRYTGPYSRLDYFADWVNGLAGTVNKWETVEEETGYRILYHIYAYRDSYVGVVYDNGGVGYDSVAYVGRYELVRGYTYHTLTLDAGAEDAYFYESGERTATVTNRPNGTYRMSDFTCYTTWFPRRESTDGEYTVAYWTDENNNKYLPDEEFVYDHDMTMTAHWVDNVYIQLHAGSMGEGIFTPKPIDATYTKGYSHSDSWMYLTEGEHSYSELRQPMCDDVFYPVFMTEYLFEQVGWRNSLEGENGPVHALDETFTLTAGTEAPEFTAVWELKKVLVSFDDGNYGLNLQAAPEGSPLADIPPELFGGVYIPVGGYTIEDFPVVADRDLETFRMSCCAWEETWQNTRFDAGDIISINRPMNFKVIWEAYSWKCLFQTDHGGFEGSTFTRYPVEMLMDKGVEYTMADMPVPVSCGCWRFAGWSIWSWYGNILINDLADTVTVDDVTCFDAVWEEVPGGKHSFGREWSSDPFAHWHECLCGERKDQTLHADADGDCFCDVCGRPMITADLQYLMMEPGEEAEIHLTKPLDADEYHYDFFWEVVDVEGENVIDLDSYYFSGTVTAKNPGTAYVEISLYNYYDYNEPPVTTRIRIDVLEDVSSSLTGASLPVTKATVNLYQTDYTAVDVVLETVNGGLADDLDEQNQGATIFYAYFTDDNAARWFDLQPLDDRRVAIIPTEEALDNPSAVPAALKSAIRLAVWDITKNEGYRELETNELTLSVKKTLPSLKAAALTVNSTAGGTYDIRLTGGKAQWAYLDWDYSEVPDWLCLDEEDLTLTVYEGAPAKGTFKLRLWVCPEGWQREVPVVLTVKVVNTPPAIKFKTAALTVRAGTSDVSSTTFTVSPDVYRGSGIELVKATETVGGKTAEVDLDGLLDVHAGTGMVSVRPLADDGKAHTYKLYYNAGGKDAVLTVKVTTAAPKLSLKVSGSVDNTYPGCSAAVTAKVDGSVTDPWFVLESVTATKKGQPDMDVTGRFDIEQFDPDTAVLSLREGGQIESGWTCTALVEAHGLYADDRVVSATVKIPVKTSRPAAPTLTIKNTGYIDVLRKYETQVTVTPTVKNLYSRDMYGLNATIWKTYDAAAKKKVMEPANGLFTILYDRDVIRIWQEDGSVLNPADKFAVEVTLSKGDVTITSKLTPFTVKSGKAAVLQDVKTLTMYKKDAGSWGGVKLYTTDDTLNWIDIGRTTLDAASASRFELDTSSFDDEIVLRFAEGASVRVSTTYTVKLGVFIVGNCTDKPNATVTVKVTVR